MEELGKYESIQDRIKRLSKGQNQTTANAINQLQASYSSKLKDNEDSKKQNIPQFTLSKKRQSPNNDYKELLASLSPKQSSSTKFQSLGYGNMEPSQDQYKEISPMLKKSQSQYYLQKPIRQSKENIRTRRDYTNLNKKNQSIDDITTMLNQKYPSKMYFTQSSQDRSLAFNYETDTLTKRRQSTLDAKKSSNILTNRPGFTQVDNFLEKYKADLGQIKKEENSDFQKTASSADEGFTGRMLKKCRSGMIERVPGKIVRNK